MRSLHVAVAAFGWTGVLIVVGVSACADRESDCAANYSCPYVSGSSVGSGLGVPCDPYENPDALNEECGVFTSTLLGDDANRGTPDAPVKTLAEAIQRAWKPGPRGEEPTKRVYACADPFKESVRVPAGTSIYGGLDCAKRWTLANSKTLLVAGSNNVPMKLDSGVERTLIKGMEIIAPPSTAPGSSSIAMIIDDVEAEIDLSRLEARDAAAGADGESNSSQLSASPAGKLGSEACHVGESVYVGDPGMQSCAGVTTSGGAGGIGSMEGGVASDGKDGIWGEGIGGKGGKGHLGLGQCPPESHGGDGPSGEPGAPGAGAVLVNGEKLLGSLSPESGYVGVAGRDGAPGRLGGGGGGGGGTEARMCGGKWKSGLSGGGGGAGGCGGKPGTGGGGGGSSIALVILGEQGVTLRSVELKAGNGGNGGSGGEGQPGAVGGLGGAMDWDRCPGGKGGDGGKGGRGGGGSGGHSLGIASIVEVSVDSSVTILLGEPGAGGEGEGTIGTGAPGQAIPKAVFSE